MANNKFSHFQQIRLRVVAPGEIVVQDTALEKGYSRVHGLSISFPEENTRIGATLGIVIGQLEVLPDNHEAKKVSVDTKVAANQRWFFPNWNIEGNGAPISVRFRDGSINSYLQAGSPGSGVVPAQPLPVNFPYDAIVNLWLTNSPL